VKILIIGHESGRIETETNGSENSVLCIETNACVEAGEIDLTGYRIKRIFLNHDKNTVRIFIQKEISRAK